MRRVIHSPIPSPTMSLMSSTTQGKVIQCLHEVRISIFSLVVYPLRVLFFRGPSLWGYGFGGGSRPENMCQSFTDVRSEFWSSSDTTQTECFEILERRFHAFVVGLVALSAVAVCIQTVYLSVSRYFILKPLNEVNRNLERVIEVIEDFKNSGNSSGK